MSSLCRHRLFRLSVTLAVIAAAFVLSRQITLPPPVEDVIPEILQPDPVGLVIHHSDTPIRMRGRYVDAAMLDEFHKQQGFGVEYRGKVYHIGYHYVILPDGRIEPGRPEHCTGAHCRIPKYNRLYLGICLIGTFQPGAKFYGTQSPTHPTQAQLDSLVALSTKLVTKYHMDVNNIIGHRDVVPTHCPGRNVSVGWLRGRVARATGQPVRTAQQSSAQRTAHE